MDLEELINSIDIVEYISQFVDLEEKNGEYWGLSPFSDEKTPSFSVRRENNTFYCFSSGIGGNVFTFTKYYFKCTAKQAIDKLLEYIGADGKELTSFKKMSTVMMCKKFMKQKKKPKENSTKKYPNDCMNRYEEREDKLAVWESEGISRETLQEFQVKYDAFSNRLMYPIRNLNGDIVNIGGRTLAPDWKERKMRKYTYLSSWGEMSVIYGLFENMQYILEKHEIILFEGCKSVLMLIHCSQSRDYVGCIIMKSFKDRRELRDAITDESSINMSVEEYVLSNYDVLTLENGGKIIISQIQDDYTCLVNEGCREYMIDVNQRCFSLESNKIREAIERKAQEIINSEEKDTQEITHFLSQFKVKSADST